MHWSARWLRTLEEARAKTLGDTLRDVQTRILVKTLAFKLEVGAEALVHTLPHTLADAEATILQDTQGEGKELLDILTDTLAGARASTLLDTLRDVEAKALVDTLADLEAKAKAGTPGITPAHIKPEVLINRLANTLVQAKSGTLGDTGGS